MNNGVYRAGFATRQRAYERAAARSSPRSIELESRLTTSRYLFGNRIVEVRLASLLHARSASTSSITSISNATSGGSSITRICRATCIDLYQQPGIAETVNFDHIKRHYYMTHDAINPTRIVPIGPILDLTQPHGRERLSRA